MEEKRVLELIERYGLLEPDMNVGAAVSGGADSMAMLAMLKKLGYRVTVLHFEHGIRPVDSERDMRFVKEFCEKNGAPFFCERADVPAMREKGESLETAARRLRYAFFERAAGELGLARIATAHHADDNAETVLMNLLRGSGVTGMRGISPARGIYVRPMLALTRAEIEAYVHKNGVPFVTDMTNFDETCTRNRIRGAVLPVFYEINPGYARTILRACELISEQDEAFLSVARGYAGRLSEPVKGGLALDIAELGRLEKGLLSAVIRNAVSRVCPLRDVERVHVDAVISLALAGRTGKCFVLEGKFAAFVSYNRLIITDKLYKIERSGEFALAPSGPTRLWEGVMTAEMVQTPCFATARSLTQYFDAESLLGAVVRTRRPGDVFYPLGAPGPKKLKEWLIDKKVPSFLRGGLPLVARGSEILWVVGFGISERAKVTAGGGVCALAYEPQAKGYGMEDQDGT